MNIIVLGSGTSTGVPVIGKNTPVNRSEDIRDKRMRTSIFIDGKEPVIVDTGPDFRMQMIDNRISSIKNVLYTHSHYDHIGGLDDLRPLSYQSTDGIFCYSDEETHKEIIARYQYFFANETYYGKPKIIFQVLPLNDQGIYRDFYIGDTHVQPVKLMHISSKPLYSVGYVFNRKAAYLTDFRSIMPEYMDFVSNLDLIIAGAPLCHPHPNHLSIDEAVKLIQSLRAKKGVITHLADEKFHRELEKELPDTIKPAYDGMVIKI